MENIPELEKQLKALYDGCNKCGGNFNDDCRDCKQFDERIALKNKIDREKENLNKALENLRKIPGGDIYDDMQANAKQHNKEVKKYLEKENKRKQEIQDKDNKIKELESKLQESENKYKYLLADLDNIKKRYNKQINDLHEYEGENIFKDIISNVCDDFDYIFKYNNGNTLDKENVRVIYRRLLNILEKYGITQMYEENTRDAMFNEKTDDAVSQITTNDKTLDNSINSVIKKGYNFKDKVLRFEQVLVNKYIE